MSYEMKIAAGVTGQQQLDQLTQATEKQEDRTKRVAQAIQDYIGKSEKLSEIQAKLALKEIELEQLRERHRMQLERLAASSSGAAGANDQFNGSLTRTAGGARAASAELAVLEGRMTTMAAGRFLTMFAGGATAALFPIAGGVALLGVLDKIVGKVGDWANAHNPVLQAQQTSLSLLKQEGEEYDRLAQKVRELNREKLKRQFGAGFVDRLDAADAARAAKQEDQDQINRLTELQGRLTRLSQVVSIGGGGVSTLHQAPLSEADTHISAQLKAALGLKPEDKTGLEGLVNKAGGVPNVSEAGAARDLSIGVDQALARAREQQGKDLAESGEKKAAADKDAATKAEEAARKREAIENRTLELEKRSTERYATAFFADDPTPQRKYSTALAHIGEEREDALRKDGADPARVNAAFDLQKIAAFMTYLQDASKAMQQFNEATQKGIAAIDKGMERGERLYDPTFPNIGSTNIGGPSERYASPQEQLRLARDRGSSAMRSARGGSPDDIFSARKIGIDAVYEAEVRLGHADDALIEKQQKLREAEQDRLDAVQALLDKQTEQARALAGGLFDAIRGRSTNHFFRSFAVGQEKQLFENLASPAILGATHILGSAIPNTGAIGTLLHGTVFDSANADPSKATATYTKSTAQNTLDTVKELRALRGGLTGQNGDPNSAPVGLYNLPSTNALNPFFGGGGLLGTGIGAGSTTLGKAFGQNSPLSQFFSGIGAGGDNPIGAILTGQAVSSGRGANLTDAQRAGVAAGTAAMLAGAGMTIASGLSQGGAGGILKAASGGLGAASLIPGPQQPFIAAGAAAAGILAGMFSSGPEQRARQIFNTLAQNQYLAPTALNVTQGMDGTYTDFGARGNLRTSSMSAVPFVSQPYITSRVYNGQRTYYDAPGQVIVPYSGGPVGTGVTPVSNAPGAGSAGAPPTIIIQALDSESLHEYLQKPKNAMAVGESVASHLQSHEGRLSNAIRFVAA